MVWYSIEHASTRCKQETYSRNTPRHTHTYVHLHIRISLSLCTYIYIYTYVCVYVYIYIHIYMSMSLSLSLYTYMYIYADLGGIVRVEVRPLDVLAEGRANIITQKHDKHVIHTIKTQ